MAHARMYTWYMLACELRRSMPRSRYNSQGELPRILCQGLRTANRVDNCSWISWLLYWQL